MQLSTKNKTSDKDGAALNTWHSSVVSSAKETLSLLFVMKGEPFVGHVWIRISWKLLNITWASTDIEST